MKVFSLCLSFLNFLPLWVAVLFVDARSIFRGSRYLGAEKAGIGSILLGIVFSIATVSIVLRKRHPGNDGELFYIRTLHERKTLTAEILLSYVLPLMAFDFTKWDELSLFLVFFFTILWLSVKYSVISGSIFLELLNYRYYDCEGSPAKSGGIGSEKTCQTFQLLCKGSLAGKEGDTIKMALLNDQTRLAIME